MLGKIRPFYFFVAFAIGALACYIMTPPPEVILRFPSPYNAGRVVYKDANRQSCFTYNADKVACPADAGLVRQQPFAEDFKGRK